MKKVGRWNIREKVNRREQRENPFETSWTEVQDYGMSMMNSEDSFDCTTKSSCFQRKEGKQEKIFTAIFNALFGDSFKEWINQRMYDTIILIF